MPTNETLEEQTNNDSSTDNTSRTIQIPTEFLYVYSKLLLLMIELGESMLHNCKALCDTKNMPIVECYHMYKAALAANQLAASSDIDASSKSYYTKLSNTLLNYVKTQLDCITENYGDIISFVEPDDVESLVNIFIDMANTNTEIIVQPTDSTSMRVKSVIRGVVMTENYTGSNYGLNASQLSSKTYWHVIAGDEFVPGTSALYINGVRYILDDDDYEEWIVVEDEVSKGVGVRLKTGFFDVDVPADEVYVEAVLLNPNVSSD